MHDACSRVLHAQATSNDGKRGGLQVCCLQWQGEARTAPCTCLSVSLGPHASLLFFDITFQRRDRDVSNLAYDCIGRCVTRCCQCFHDLHCLSQSCLLETDITRCLSRISHYNKWLWSYVAKGHVAMVTQTRFCGPPACLRLFASPCCCTWLH